MTATVLDFDGFDDYTTAQILRENIRVTGAPTIVSGGRNGGNRLRFNSNSTIAICRAVPTSPGEVVVSFIFNPVAIRTAYIVEFRDVERGQILIRLNADGSLSALLESYIYAASDWGDYASTLLGSSGAGLITAGIDQRIDLRVKIDNTVGEIEFRLNGVQILNLSGIDTRCNSGVISNFLLGCSAQVTTTDFYFDDLYVATSFLGTDVRVDSHYSIADGANTDFTPSSGTDHFAMVDESTADDDTTKVTATTPGSRDTYKVEAFKNPGGTIYSVKTCLTAKKVEANSAQLATCIRSGSTNYDGTAQGLTTDWANLGEVANTDPGTSAAWAETAFGAGGTGEFGMHKAA
jgi:uncharacterized protein CbrC (UPF0167 family)